MACWSSGKRERCEDDAGRHYSHAGLCEKKKRDGGRRELIVSISAGAPLEGREKGEGKVLTVLIQVVAAYTACP